MHTILSPRKMLFATLVSIVQVGALGQRKDTFFA
jgi:hypothetical protein